MSAGCSYQNPKQLKVTSVDLPGLLLDILTMIES